MLDTIKFKGYKSFKVETELELKPVTVLFGKNSSGKSAVAKLPTLIEGALSLDFDEPLMYINKGIELGADYRDLFYKGEIQGEIDFSLKEGNNELKISIINTLSIPLISKLEIHSEKDGSVIFDYKTQEEQSTHKSTRGFLLDEHPSKSAFHLKTDYLGPFRIKPHRIFYINDLRDPNSIGGMGDKAYYIIAKNEELEKRVSEWFKKNFDGWELFVDRKQPYYELKIRRDSNWDGVNIVDVGQGMSQALPIIIKALTDYKNEEVLNILEQPELHLHPAAHGSLAELLFNSTQNSNNRYLIETHSKNFILRLRTLIAKGIMKKEDLNLCFVDYDEDIESSIIKKINVNDIGEVDYWPEHIFDESFVETIALKVAQKENKSGS
ncbi:AAA family ATPase [Epilithonimonas pallida]|uniref:Predicted ATPase n=1 Tax=Epilithonimonas pallida TaxID=373671 RepID=A0ABY1R6U4_9FLAO|nr:AAA family ATPase [Epilithonimonas pallida]SMP95464.1 Predicted ATPase [Epilithonimonas pallida]